MRLTDPARKTRELDTGDGAPHLAPEAGRCEDLLRIGQLLAGNFEARRLLGSGGMGQVYEALDRGLNRLVAIKVAWPHVGSDALRREAQALAAFRHTGLVTAHALGREGSTEFLVMERLFGAPLSERLQHGAGARRLPIGETVELLIAIAEALQEVHHAGLAHCDLKPSNIMLTPGRVGPRRRQGGRRPWKWCCSTSASCASSSCTATGRSSRARRITWPPKRSAARSVAARRTGSICTRSA